jgi:spore maturation protein CgeB
VVVRVLVVDPYYEAFLARHYAAHPDLAARSYRDQRDSLLAQGFGTSDAYSRGFSRLGHDAEELIPNCPPLQVAWARENGAASWARRLLRLVRGRGTRAAWRLISQRIVEAQIHSFAPDVVYFQDLGFPRTGLLDRIRGSHFVVGQIASPAPAAAKLRQFDLIITSFPHFVERFRGLGVPTEYLPLAFDSLVLERLANAGVSADPESERPYPVAFVGGLDPRTHVNGTAVLEQVCARRRVDIWGYAADVLDADSPIRRHYHGEAWGIEMYEVLAGSKIVINRHIDAAEGYSNNMRLYEATGAGALLMTEASPNLGEIFDPGREVVAYAGLDDLTEQLQHFAENDGERRRIAAAGQSRTLRDHSYEHRVRELAAIIEDHR